MNNFVILCRLPTQGADTNVVYFHDLHAVKIAFEDMTDDNIGAVVYGLNKKACEQLLEDNKKELASKVCSEYGIDHE